MKPVLVIMAAGLGSRYGGLKQIASVDAQDHLLIDYSIYDAVRAGFDKVVCIIKPELEKDFDERIANRLRGSVNIEYAYQTLDRLPDGFAVPPGHSKQKRSVFKRLSVHIVDKPCFLASPPQRGGGSKTRRGSPLQRERIAAQGVTPQSAKADSSPLRREAKE